MHLTLQRKEDKYVIDTSSIRNRRHCEYLGDAIANIEDFSIMGLSSILSTLLVLEDTIESVKSVGSKESSPNSISRNHSIEPMAPQPSFELTAVERGKLFEIKIDLVTTDPRAGPGVMRGGVIFPRLSQPGPRRRGKGKNKNEFRKCNVSMDQLSKFFHHPPGKVAKNRFLPHHRLSTPSDTPGPHVSVYFISGISRIP